MLTSAGVCSSLAALRHLGTGGGCWRGWELQFLGTKSFLQPHLTCCRAVRCLQLPLAAERSSDGGWPLAELAAPQLSGTAGGGCTAPALPVLSPPVLTVPTQPEARLCGGDDVVQRPGRGLGPEGQSPGSGTGWTQKAPGNAQHLKGSAVRWLQLRLGEHCLLGAWSYS